MAGTTARPAPGVLRGSTAEAPGVLRGSTAEASGTDVVRTDVVRTHRLRGLAGLVVCLIVLGLLVIASLAIGSNGLSPARVWAGLVGDDGEARAVVRGLRMDRTVLAAVVGAALGLAGALMQALTRNPLADPGILGVNAGAAAAVITAAGVFGVTNSAAYVWFGLVGALIASVAVYLLGSGGRAGATPVRLALAGAALTAVLTAYVSGLTLTDQRLYDTYRFWVVGSVNNRDLSLLADTAAFLVIGALVAFACTASLNVLALGEDTGRSLGASPTRTRLLSAVAIALLAGSATAIAGPIAFVGLTVPHLARSLIGPDQRWILPMSTVFGATLVLLADVLGRVVAPSGEVQVGVMCAFLGAPVFIGLVRRRRLVEL